MVARRQKIGDSQKLRDAALAKRKGSVLVLKGVGAPIYRMLTLQEMERLGVDPTYQRIKITEKINELTQVLLSGGEIPDPVAIAERLDKSRWIIDGQQRFWAHMEARLPLKVAIYHVATIELERSLFIALNNSALVRTEYVVRAWAGPSSDLLREITDDEAHPLHGFIDFGEHRHSTVACSVLIRAVELLLTGSGRGKGIVKTLAACDKALARPDTKERAAALLTLVGLIRQEHGTRLPMLAVLAIAIVAREQWAVSGEPTIPDGK